MINIPILASHWSTQGCTLCPTNKSSLEFIAWIQGSRWGPCREDQKKCMLISLESIGMSPLPLLNWVQHYHSYSWTELNTAIPIPELSPTIPFLFLNWVQHCHSHSWTESPISTLPYCTLKHLCNTKQQLGVKEVLLKEICVQFSNWWGSTDRTNSSSLLHAKIIFWNRQDWAFTSL